MNNYNFSEFENLLKALKGPGFLTKPGMEKIIAFLEDIVNLRDKSDYFHMIDPKTINKDSPRSQCRTININIENKTVIKGSVLANGIQCPVLCGETGEIPLPFELFNGRHRLESLIEINEENNLSAKIPAVIIPSDRSALIARWLVEIQSILNEKEPSASNNYNDIKKALTTICERDSLDLRKPTVYDGLLRRAKLMFRHRTEKNLRNVMTRIRNTQAVQASNVYCAQPIEFETCFRETQKQTIEGTLSKADRLIRSIMIENQIIKPVSMVGSGVAQLWTRSACDLSENPGQKISWMYYDGTNKGNAHSVINSRKSFFEKVYRICTAFEKMCGRAALPFNEVIIAPQVQSELSLNIGGSTATSLAEDILKANHWIRIPAEEILKTFKNKTVWRREWIYREKKDI